MITCCELALYTVIGAFGVILALLAMFFNYTLKLKDRQIILEKKNGKEQKQIDDLRSKLLTLQSKGNELKKEVESLKETSRRLKSKNA